MRADRATVRGIDRHVGGRILQYRVSRGLTGEDLAHAIGIDTENLRDYEEGKVRPNAALLFEISKALDVELARFFDGLDLSRLS